MRPIKLKPTTGSGPVYHSIIFENVEYKLRSCPMTYRSGSNCRGTSQRFVSSSSLALMRFLARKVADLQDISRHLFQSLADRPAMHRFECENLQEKEIQGSLNCIFRFAHLPLTSVTEMNTPFSTR